MHLDTKTKQNNKVLDKQTRKQKKKKKKQRKKKEREREGVRERERKEKKRKILIDGSHKYMLLEPFSHLFVLE